MKIISYEKYVCIYIYIYIYTFIYLFIFIFSKITEKTYYYRRRLRRCTAAPYFSICGAWLKGSRKLFQHIRPNMHENELRDVPK